MKSTGQCWAHRHGLAVMVTERHYAPACGRRLNGDRPDEVPRYCALQPSHGGRCE